MLRCYDCVSCFSSLSLCHFQSFAFSYLHFLWAWARQAELLAWVWAVFGSITRVESLLRKRALRAPRLFHTFASWVRRAHMGALFASAKALVCMRFCGNRLISLFLLTTGTGKAAATSSWGVMRPRRLPLLLLPGPEVGLLPLSIYLTSQRA